MNKKIEEIKKLESPPKVIKGLYTQKEINEFMELYKSLPIATHNKNKML